MENEVRDPYEYEVDLRDYIKVIWKEKWLIALVFIIAVGAALAFSLSNTPKYRTRASLIITSPVADQLVEQTGNTRNPVDFDPKFDYKEVGFSNEMVETIITDLNLTDSSSETRSLNSLKNQMSINLAFPGNSDNETNKPVLVLVVTGSNREVIKDIADKWATLYLQQASEVLLSEVERYHESISKEHSRVQEDLQEKIEQRIEARREHNLELLKIEANVLRKKYETYLSSLDPKKLELEKKRAELSKLNSILEDEPSYIYLERSASPENISAENQLSEDEAREDAKKEEENDNSTEERDTKSRDQTANETFLTFKLDTDLGISSLETEVDYLSSKLDEFRSQINDKQATIDRVKTNREKLESEINNLKKESDSLFAALEKARRAKDESSTIRILSGPDSIETLESVNTKQNVAVAGVLGLFIGVLVAFFKNYMEEYEEETEKEENGNTEDQ